MRDPQTAPQPRWCVATVTDEQFLPGTLVLFRSFIRHNPGFEGGLVVLHDALTERGRRVLEAVPGVELRRVGRRLRERVAGLADPRLDLARNRTRLFDLQAFDLDGYERVLYLDSDVLCTGDAGDLFTSRGGLQACPDQSHYLGLVRDPRTFAPVEAAELDSTAPTAASFNTGVMLIDRSALPENTFDRLLQAVHPDSWAEVTTGHTDQVILTRHFRGGWHQLPDRYNHLVSARCHRYVRPRAPLDDAVFVHYVGRPKPWAARGWASVHGERRYAFRRWEEAWSEYALWRLREKRDVRPLLRQTYNRVWRTGARLRRRVFGPRTLP